MSPRSLEQGLRRTSLQLLNCNNGTLRRLSPFRRHVLRATRLISTVGIDSKEYVGNGGFLQHGEASGKNLTEADLGDRVHNLLPSRWYRDEKVYQLERRAVFSKYWHIASFIGRFKKPGDYLSLEMHGWSLYLIKGHDGNINAFHNVCRHRGHPITQKESGCSSILACKYHGWSYTTTGQLHKAPKYSTLSDFDPKAHSLFEIHTHVTPQGFIFVNFDSSPTPSISFHAQFGEHFEQPLPSNKTSVVSNEYCSLQPADHWTYDNTWKSSSLGTKFNWKTYADGFQECYHCPTGHPSTLPQILDFKSYYVRQGIGAARHFAALKKEVEETLGQSYITWLFPLGAIVFTDNMLYIERFDARSATDTRIQHETYRSKDIPSEGEEHKSWLEEEVGGWRFIETEDIGLSQATQKGFTNATFSQGRLHPVQEHAVKWYQDKLRQALLAHAKSEAELGKAIDYSTPKEQAAFANNDPLGQLLGNEIEV